MPMVPVPRTFEEVVMGHRFRLGDRVVCTTLYQDNEKIIGVQGVVMRAQTWRSTVGVVYDEDVEGHDGDTDWYRQCADGRGWNTATECLRYLGKRVNPATVDLGTVVVKPPESFMASGVASWVSATTHDDLAFSAYFAAVTQRIK